MLRLSCRTSGWFVDLPVSHELIVGFNFQLAFDRAFKCEEAFPTRLAPYIAEALVKGLEDDLRPAKPAQVEIVMRLAASQNRTLQADSLLLQCQVDQALADL